MRLPIQRKKTKYIARASSDLENSVPVVIALRDMLKLANSAREVKKMITQKLLKINGRIVFDMRESIHLFNILEAGKTYILKLSQLRKFFLEESKDSKERLCKVIGKSILKGKKIQLNLHDGTNIIGDNKFKIGDSIYLSLDGKIKKHISPEKGGEVFIIKGRYEGQSGKISDIHGKKLLIKFKEGSSNLDLESIILL